jgi:hypothetical protein
MINKKSLKIPKGQSEGAIQRTRQCNGQKKKDKKTNNDQQNTSHKIKD